MGENKTGKYLKYAIGEIVLVVIGILIALQINNWNENRKSRTEERLLLLDLKEDLIRNKEQINVQVNQGHSSAKSIEKLIKVIKGKQVYHDSLQQYFHLSRTFPDPNVSTTSYEVLKNKGINIIQNKTLRKQIVDLYELSYSDMISKTLRLENQIRPAAQEHLVQNFETIGIEREAWLTPNNYEELLNDQVYLNIISQRLQMHNYWIFLKEVCLEQIDDLIKLIDQELTNE